jgi:KilA-N domain
MQKNTDDLIRSWLRNRNTVEFLGIWEQLNNPDFNPVQFDGFRKQAGLNSFTLTPKQWIEMTHARGIARETRTVRRYLCSQGYRV